MFKYLIFLAAVAAVALAEDGGESITPFVTGGIVASIGQFASGCFIDTPLELGCQGEVLDSRSILTAAACVVNQTNSAVIHPFHLRVTCGDWGLTFSNPGREVRAVSHIFPHDQYNTINQNNGLAVLRLATPIPMPHNTVEEAIIQERIVPDNTNCQFAGWGAPNNLTDNMNNGKMVITTPIVNRADCNAMASRGRIVDELICAGLTVGAGNPPAATVAQGVCRGNLGGGLYCNDRLTGILTFGVGCGATQHPGVYTQPRFYRPWINQQLTRTDTIAPGTVFPRA